MKRIFALRYLLKFLGMAAIQLLLGVENTIAQSRVNQDLPIISEEILWTMKSATGWKLTTEGQWIEGKNKIQREGLGALDTEEFEKGINVTGFDNFIELQIREITVESVSFLLFTKRFIKGEFKSPLTKSGFNPSEMVSFVVIKKNYSKFDEPTKEYNTPIFYWGSVPFSPTYLKDISLQINKLGGNYPWIITSPGTNSSFTIYFSNVDEDESLSRFFITSSFDLAPNYGQNLMIPVDNNTLYREPLIKFYYETDTENIIPIISVIKKEN